MKNFLVKLFVFSFIIAIADFCWMYFTPLQKHVPYVWLLLGFFVCATAGFHFIIMKASQGNPQNFVRAYMGVTSLKLLLYLGVILIYAFSNKPTAFQFVFGFLAHYFLFTVFEVRVLLGQLRRK